MLTLRAPYQNQGRWCLEGVVDLSTGDTFTVRAELTPRTLAWARGVAGRAAMFAGRTARRGSTMVRYEGDWGAFMPVAEAAFDQIAEATGYPNLAPSKKLLAVKDWYEKANGKKGADAAAEAAQVIAATTQAAAAGVPEAQEDAGMLAALNAADKLLTCNGAYDALGCLTRECEAEPVGSDSPKLLLLQATKALGSCCCSSTDIVCSADAEELITAPDKYLDFCRYARDVMLLRSLGSRQRDGYSQNSTAQHLRNLYANCRRAPAYDGPFGDYAAGGQ